MICCSPWPIGRAICEVDAEDALRRAALKFERRFECMEQAAERGGLALDELEPAQWDELWRDAKSLTKEE